jgi:hypothetical protein
VPFLVASQVVIASKSSRAFRGDVRSQATKLKTLKTHTSDTRSSSQEEARSLCYERIGKRALGQETRRVIDPELNSETCQIPDEDTVEMIRSVHECGMFENH